MSHFLETLIARTFGSVEPVQPRLRSRYAIEQPAPTAPTWPMLAIETVNEPPISEVGSVERSAPPATVPTARSARETQPEQPAIDPPAPSSLPALQPAARRWPSRLPAPEQTALPTPLAAPQSPQLQRSEPLVERSALRPIQAQPLPTASEPSAPPRLPTSTPAAAPEFELEPPPPITRRQRSSRLVAEPLPVVVPVQRQASPASVVESSAPNKQTQPAILPARHAVVPQAAQQLPSNTTAAPTPSPKVASEQAMQQQPMFDLRLPAEPSVALPAPNGPVVRVTIGRLEVRAMLPAPAASPPRQRTPSLSLDAYLRSRKEGQR